MIVLASRSPQRRALLGALGVEFRVVASRADEGPDPVANARAKAEEVVARAGVPAGGAVLGADTEVILDGRALGKPPDRDAAEAMLRSLSGRAHVVRSAVCICTAEACYELADEATVTFRALTEPLLAWYLDGGEWRDRAGGYAIQGSGAALVLRVDGDPSTVVGLPVSTLAAALEGLGLTPWAAAPRDTATTGTGEAR